MRSKNCHQVCYIYSILRHYYLKCYLDIIKVPLSHLNVSSNMLTRLPISLRHMNSLSVFHCENNPLEWPPAQVTSFMYVCVCYVPQ